LRKTYRLSTGQLQNICINSIGSLFQLLPLYPRKNQHALLNLSSQLRLWDKQRLSASPQPKSLSLQDIHTVKQMIDSTAKTAAIPCPEVFLDQMFFLTVGAIQTHAQTGSDKAWQLVHQAIQSYLEAQQEKKTWLMGILVTTLVICFSSITLLNNQTHHNTYAREDFPIAESAGNTDPVTISTLLLAYNKMKAGTCQLPQAAMLPPEQRQAYLRFVNTGYIEVEHVEDLRLALGYVNCLYPQELMHPTSTDSKKL
jgi:hypothetical protein